MTPIKQFLRSIKLRLLALPLSLVLVFTHCNEDIKIHNEKEIEISAISKGLNAFIGDGKASMKNVSTFFLEKYDLDFDQEYQKLKSKFIDKKQKSVAARAQAIDLYNFQEVLNNNGISNGSYSYNYLSQLSDIFENGTYEEWEVRNIMNQMRSDIANNASIAGYEKNNLLATWDALNANYDGLVQVAYSINNGGVVAISRTQGWFKTVWRIVRSVILTAGVGALIGSTTSPVGAIVGAIVMGTVAIVDAAANDYCHFAMQCSGGWRQDCKTGKCMPYPI